MSGWQAVRIEDLEPIPVVGGTLLWKPLRRTLGVEAFGINAYVAPNAGDDVVESHTESTLRHEEVYVVLTGRATFTLDGESLDAPAGTVVFVRDPLVRRHARATEPQTQVLAVGGPRDEAYEPSPWEDVFAAPDHPATLYNLACAEALAGRTTEALDHLRLALELRPELETWAREDEVFVPLRKHPEWPLARS